MNFDRVLAQACVAACMLWIPSHAQATTTAERCAKADVTLTQTGRGDSDHDGISNCTERYILGTSSRDWDSDDDDVADGQEVEDGTNPVDADSDDDGLDDGSEAAAGTSATDADSDDDGLDDSDDADPSSDLDEGLEGNLLAITCPSGGADGSLNIHGIVITLTSSTEFDGSQTCDAITASLAAGPVHAEVDLLDTGLVAESVSLDDSDEDGSPDSVDDDDDDDGIPDDSDPDSSGQ